MPGSRSRSRTLLSAAIVLAAAGAALLVIIVARSISGPGGAARPVPAHTETWAYDDSRTQRRCNGGAGADAALVRRWLTFAETNCGPRAGGGPPPKALRDCHAGGRTYCRVMAYVDTNLVYRANSPGDLLAVASESWFAHETSPHHGRRVTTAALGGGYLMNQDSAAYRTWWRSYVNRGFAGADGLFMDDQSPHLPFFGLSSPSSAETPTASALQAAHARMSRALTRRDGTAYPQIDNTIPDCGNPYENEQGIGPTGSMLSGPVIGLVAEGCPIDHGTITPYYAGLLDDIAMVSAARSGAIVLLAYGRSGTPYAERGRRVTEATDLLAYQPGRVVAWPDLEQNNRDLAVWPEQGIYPTGPVQRMSRPSGAGCLTGGSGVPCPSGGHNDLAAPGQPGVYRREFRACYDRSAPFGPCAAIVNTTGAAVAVAPSWLSQPYRSQIGFTIPPGTSGDVQSGGTIDLAGGAFAAGSTTIPAHDAMLLGDRVPG